MQQAAALEAQVEELHTALRSEREAAAADLSLQLAETSTKLQQEADSSLQAALTRCDLVHPLLPACLMCAGWSMVCVSPMYQVATCQGWAQVLLPAALVCHREVTTSATAPQQ